ncbi:hypothetical protein C8R45DRAFT_944902 [Mycena sanguinolenta]|nr:hypothetical protein C8R45DRAFT_944902 [Mycena sanguinolenta]
MSTGEDVLVPYTEILRQECPRHVALIRESQPIAERRYQSGAGKSALINAVFGLEGATPVSHRTPGVHDIEPFNDRIIIHDSQGFEPGEEENIQTVSDFIRRRSNMPALADQLHPIWVCAEIPFAGGRIFEKGVERILLEYRGNLPVIVVFTKLDALRNWEDGDEFEAALDAMATSTVQDLCVTPLYALTPRNGLQHRRNSPVLKQVSMLRFGNSLNFQSEFEVLIRFPASVGRKRYRRGLISDIFLGFTMRSVLEVWQTVIVNVWNMHDPEKVGDIHVTGHALYLSLANVRHLQKTEFLALLLVLVRNNYPLTEKAVQTIIENLAAIVIAGPTAVFVLFAEWIRGTYKKAVPGKASSAVEHLTLTMDTLFYLVLSRGQTPIKALVNSALWTTDL